MRTNLLAAVAVVTLTAVPAMAQFAVGGDARVNPDDFAITTFADDLNYPVGMVELPDGRQFLINYAGEGEHSVVELDSLAMQTPHALQEHFAARPVVVAPDADVAIMPELQWGVTNRVNGFPQFTHVLTQTNPWPTQVLVGPVNWGPPIMSIMILYTPEAKKECAGLLGIETRARLSVAQVSPSPLLPRQLLPSLPWNGL